MARFVVQKTHGETGSLLKAAIVLEAADMAALVAGHPVTVKVILPPSAPVTDQTHLTVVKE